MMTSMCANAALLFPNLQEGEAKKGFYDCLAALDCDVLIVFGKDDPWCKPAFAKKMLQSLDSRHPDRVHRYVELSNVGHCPNHEAPQAVAHLLSVWAGVASEERQSACLMEGKMVLKEKWGEITAEERQSDQIQVSFIDQLATVFVG